MFPKAKAPQAKDRRGGKDAGDIYWNIFLKSEVKRSRRPVKRAISAYPPHRVKTNRVLLGKH